MFLSRRFILSVCCCAIIGFGQPPYATLAEESGSGRPLSDYVAVVQKRFAPAISSKCDWNDTVAITAAVDASGKIVEIGKGTGQRHEKAAAILRSLDALPPPPATAVTPFWLMVTVSHKLDKIDVGARDVAYGPYMAELQKSIKSKWFPLKRAESTKVKIKFKVFADGRMTNLKILNSSGDKNIDDVALMAANAAQPFAPLPDGSPSDVDIEFAFDYNSRLGAKKVPQINLTPAAEAALAMKYGASALSNKNYPLAVQFFEKASTIEPANIEAKKNLAEAFKGQAIYDLKTYPEQSMANFKKAKEVWPEVIGVPATLDEARKTYSGK